MRRFVCIFMLFLFSTSAAQEITSRDEGGKGYFGAPLLKYTVINDQGVLIFGGRGGWYVTPSLIVGGGLYATITEVDAAEGSVPNAPGPLDIKQESFGFELEYATNPAAHTFLTFYLFCGGAAHHYVRDKNREQHGETDFMLLLEPALGVEQSIAAWLHLNLAVSYRIVNGIEQPHLENDDYNGPAITLAIKIGKF